MYPIATGHVTGRLHRVEIWFVRTGMTVYIPKWRWWTFFLDQERSGHAPRVMIEIGTTKFFAYARTLALVTEDRLARRLLYENYAFDGERLGISLKPTALASSPSLAPARNLQSRVADGL